ncbi:hypothetical protein Golax_020002, partial [Gossypium laxum]|nr:hypothetical protein [Gossypium laxum]
MSTSGIIEDNGDCPTDGRNTKKVQFKDKGVDAVEMPVNVMSASIVSWKDLLLRNTIESSLIGKVAKLDFNTDNRLRGQFAQTELCSFSCGDKEVVEVGEGLKKANSIVGVSAEDIIKFVPWIVVERRPRQNPKESRKSAVKILFKKGDFLKLIENEAIKRKEAEGVRPKKVWVANLVANSKGAEMGKAPRLNLDLAGSIRTMFETFSSTSPSSTPEITSNPKNFSSSDAQSDSSGLTITCNRLNGNNFLEWSQSVKIFLLGRKRLGYITDEIKKAVVPNTGFANWIRDNGQRRLFQFLQGLNKDLDKVRGRVLAISPLPSLREAFSMVKKEENRSPVTPMKLHGKPQDWKSKDSRDNKLSLVAATSVTIFTKEQIAELQKLFGKFQGSCEGNLVMKKPEGNPSSIAFFSSQLTSNWILDSDATDHLTGNKALFRTLFQTFGKAVKTADGSLCKIKGHGTVVLNEQIALKN